MRHVPQSSFLSLCRAVACFLQHVRYVQISNVFYWSANKATQQVADFDAECLVIEQECSDECLVLVIDDQKTFGCWPMAHVNIRENPDFARKRFHTASGILRPDWRPTA